MGRKTIDTTLDLVTRVFVAELADGTQICSPLADPTLISIGRDTAALDELRLFLEEYLTQQPPEVLASFAFPPETELRELEVQVSREDLPPRLQLTTPISFAAVVIPHGRDHWVVVPALEHTFHVAPGENLEQAVSAEVRRMVVASEPTPPEFARLLPARAYRLEPLELLVDRSTQMVAGTARALRKKVIQRKQRADALEVLCSIGTPLHASLELLRGPPLCGRERELELLHGLLTGKQRMGVMLVGPDLSGKTALFHGWLRREHEAGRELSAFATSGAQLIAGMSGLGQWQERVRRVLQAAEQLDALLFFDNLTDLFGDRPEGKVDLAGAIRPFVEEGRVRLLGELRPEALDLFESRHMSFVSALHRVRVEPMDAAAAAEVLRSRVEHAARNAPHRPNLAHDAVQPLVALVDRYLPYQSHPGKGVRLYEELRAVHEQRRRGEEDWEDESGRIGEPEVLELFAMQSGIPLFLLRQDQPLELEDVVRGLGRRIIGQERAVRRVAETVCMVKANLQPAGKPLASFLFVGPTGVGKTELARSLAQFLFGSERRLLRFDMSEFMDPGAAQRLIQGTDRAEGVLTRNVRQQPFSVLLLDEIEKAHPAVFDLLLQVCGEGRLTDTGGRTAHFVNSIIIMTSNLGAAGRRAPIGIAAAPRSDEAYYEEQVIRAFRPEFVNRLDRVIAFQSLTAAQIHRVAHLALGRIARRRGLSELGLELDLSQAAVEHLAREGYSEAYGARQLRRHLEQHLVSPAAAMLAELGGRARGATLRASLEGEGSAVTSRSGRSRRESSSLARHRRGPLQLSLIKGRRVRRGSVAGPLGAISDLRREMDRRMALETVGEVRDQIDLIVAQLATQGGGKRKGQEPRGARERAELHAELHRLQQVWRRAAAQREEMETAEELALTALFEEEDPSAYVGEAGETFARFLEALFYLLVARRPRRDQATLLLQELDDGRGLDLWLRSLLERGSGRWGWNVSLHVDGGRATGKDRWPVERRWGPPRDAAWTLAELERPERRFRNLLLRVSGPYSGVCLALEQGTHRFEGFAPKPVQLSVELIARRIELTDEEWLSDKLTPISPAGLGGPRRRAPVRRFESPGGPCHVEGGRVVELGLERYWERFERVAVEQLLARIDRDDDEDLDALFNARLPDQPGVGGGQ